MDPQAAAQGWVDDLAARLPQGYWFVPGGRIYKNERMQAALQRIAQTELGLGDALGRGQVQPQWLGSYEHFYDNWP